MSEKPKLEDLLPAKKTRQPTVPKAKRDEMLIDIWIPHFVAFAFRIEDSIRAAFPAKAWTRDSTSLQAAELMKHPTFVDKMAAHIGKLEQDCEIDERFVLSGLYHQANANIYDYWEIDERGHRVMIPPERLTVHQQRNVKKMKVRNRVIHPKAGGTIHEQHIELEIVDGQRAHALLAKILGMLVDRGIIDVNLNLANEIEKATERVKQKRLQAPKESVH